MNYGRYGRELLLELKRGDDRLDMDHTSGGPGSNAPPLPAYNDELVSNCIQDLTLHVQALQDQAAAVASSSTSSSSQTPKPSMHVRPSILLQNAAIQRNKRCLLAYHVGRIERIKPFYWNSVDANVNTCPAEDEFVKDYGSLVQQYTSALGLQPDDLRAHGIVPPAPVDKVQVRVVSAPLGGGDTGGFEQGIVLDSGTSVVLTPGSTHYLLWDDVEEFVRQGYLQVLEGEELQG